MESRLSLVAEVNGTVVSCTAANRVGTVTSDDATLTIAGTGACECRRRCVALQPCSLLLCESLLSYVTLDLAPKSVDYSGGSKVM